MSDTGHQGVDSSSAGCWTPQVRVLTQLIARQPDEPVNYLLRGEEWLVCGEIEQAQADFESALQRAERLERESAWGYIYQSYIDRADAGLRQCERQINAEEKPGFETAKTD